MTLSLRTLHQTGTNMRRALYAQKIVNNTVASFRPWTAGPPMWWSRSWASWSMPEPFDTGVALVNSRWTSRGANYTGSPEWCRALCCADRLCSGWTFTDPQFSDPASNMCWMYGGVTMTGADDGPSGPACGGGGAVGHCWGGLGNTGQVHTMSCNSVSLSLCLSSCIFWPLARSNKSHRLTFQIC